MTEKSKNKENLIVLAILIVLTFFISRSNFYSFDNISFFQSFFVTNMVYSNGQELRGPPSALAYLRSIMFIIFPALFWSAFSAKKKFNTYILFFSSAITICTKIILDYLVFGIIFNVNGGLSYFKIILISFLFLCIYQSIKKISFSEKNNTLK